MSEINQNSEVNSKLLRRDGTSQSGREQAVLAPENHPLDDRNIKELERFVQGVAQLVNYFTTTRTTETGENDEYLVVEGTWEKLFSSKMPDQKERPHLALMYAFLEIWKKVQAHANTIPKRHLDFFYREFLQFTEKDAIPDKAHILFELAKNVDQYSLAANTRLSAGKDETGIERIYETDREIVLNKAIADEFKSINNPFKSISLKADKKYEISASPIANSKDGLGESFASSSPEWRSFGTPQLVSSETERSPIAAKIGFAIGSPILHMAEGERIITLKFNFGYNSDFSEVEKLSLEKVFEFGLSSEEEWIIPAYVDETGMMSEIDGDSIIFYLKLDPTQPAIIPFNAEVLEGGFVTQYPVLRALLRTQYYEMFSALQLDDIEVSVAVKGVQNLVIQNDLARLNPSKPFLPFGPKPKAKSNFYIGSEEVFYKNLTHLDVHIEWGDLPSSGFADHYQAYGENVDEGDASHNLDNSSFKVNLELYRQRQWLKHPEWASGLVPSGQEGISVFNATFNDDVVSEKTIEIDLDPVDEFEPLTITGTSPVYEIGANHGFLKLELQSFLFGGPVPVNKQNAEWLYDKFVFGHKEYPSVFAKRSLSVAGLGETGDATTFPNEPYTPIINKLSLDYEANIVIDASNEHEEFFHITPFGYELEKVKGLPETGAATNEDGEVIDYVSIVPVFNEEGNFYIGVSDFDPPQNISLLFQVVEGSANDTSTNSGLSSDGTGPEASRVDPDEEEKKVQWHYLKANNEWEKFPDVAIVSETTNGLKTSGVITFSVPRDAVSEATILPSGKHWIRASVGVGSESVGSMINIASQATLVEFVDQGNDKNHLKQALESETIKKLKTKVSQIKSVTQPYASFGGKVTEQDDEFYTRVSERLRHKGRAETFWDYEHLVLENFASMYKIKAVNHTNLDGDHDPGHVLLVGIPNIKNNNAINVLEPRSSLNTLQEIRAYLENIAPPYVDVHVVNPVYHKIHLEFSVKFHDGYDVGFHQERLHESITKYLSPWAFDEGAEISFNNSIHKYAIMNFVEEQVYVDYVFNFKLLYTPVEGEPSIETNRVEPEDPRVILVSGDKHTLDVRTTDPPPIELKYCTMAIERNFIIKS